MWSTYNTFAVANDAALELFARVGRPYILLRPPVVGKPLLNVADQLDTPAIRDEIAAWAAAARVLDASFVCERIPHEIEPYYGLPAREELLRTKWLAMRARTRVVIYACETWGGSPEYEWAWFFNGFNGDEEVQVLIGDAAATPHRWRRFNVSATNMFEFAGGEMMEDVLIFLHTPSRGGYFEPFTRGFDWMRYQVTPQSA